MKKVFQNWFWKAFFIVITGRDSLAAAWWTEAGGVCGISWAGDAGGPGIGSWVADGIDGTWIDSSVNVHFQAEHWAGID